MPHSGVSQIPLRLPVNSALGREDLIESPANATALAMVDAWPEWPGRLTILAGPAGSGKSHIASVWAGMAEAQSCPANALDHHAARLVKIASSGTNVVLEDAGRGGYEEAALFHLINAVREGGGYCMITSRSWPRRWDVKLPDLLSRLKAAQLVELKQPDDALLRQVMLKLFADRQLLVEPRVVEYCVKRMERSLEAAARLVAAIDADALAAHAKVSRSVAARALDTLDC